MIKKFPFERQHDIMDCGPTCLRLVSKHYGKYYPIQYLRERCGISKEGITLAGLGYAAEYIGFKTLSIQCTVDDLINKIQLPAILHWNAKHFVILYRIDVKYAYISDPAVGLTKLKTQDFIDKFYRRSHQNGFALLIEPTADFLLREPESRIERVKSFEKFFNYFLPYKSSFTNLFLILFLSTALQIALPFITRAVIDVGIQTNDKTFLNVLLIGNLVIIICSSLSSLIRNWIAMHITARINVALLSDYLSKIMRLPVSFFETKLFGDIIQRAQDNERIRSFIMDNLINFIFSALTLVIFTVIMFFYNTVIFGIFITGTILYVGWVFFFLKIRKKLDWELFDLNSKNQSFWFEMVSSISDIKVNNYEQKKRWKWEAIQAKFFKVTNKVSNITNAQTSGAQFIDASKSVAITFYSAMAVIDGSISFGEMVAISFMVGLLNGPVSQFIQLVIQFQYAKISFGRINEIHLLNEEEDIVKPNSIALPTSKSLKLLNVSFQYTPTTPFVLRNFSLIIPEKKVTAIVGDSGSGKTTILKLLLQLYKPSYGEILIGDMNINNISLKQYREKFGAVLQDGKLFNDTILNNIVLDDDIINYERVKEVTKIANISEEIEKLPNGYETVLGENGKGLSGGQKQRILIARALYREPDYLLLDEATNSLDTVNERKITEALANVFSDRTVVVIAHRLSTIQNADQIVVVKNGTIVELGSHQGLVEKKGFYYQLVESQAGILQNS